MKKLIFLIYFSLNSFLLFSQTFTWAPSGVGCDKKWSNNSCWAGNIAPSLTVRLGNVTNPAVISFPNSLGGKIVYDIIGPIKFKKGSFVNFNFAGNITVNLAGDFILAGDGDTGNIGVNVKFLQSTDVLFNIGILRYSHSSKFSIFSGIKLVLNSIVASANGNPNFFQLNIESNSILEIFNDLNFTQGDQNIALVIGTLNVYNINLGSDNGLKLKANGIVNHCGEATLAGTAYIFVGGNASYNSASLQQAADSNFFIWDNAAVVIRSIFLNSSGGNGYINYIGSSSTIYENLTPSNFTKFIAYAGVKNLGISPVEILDVPGGSPTIFRETNPNFWETKQAGFYLSDWCYRLLPLGLANFFGEYLKTSREVKLKWVQLAKENSYFVIERADDASLNFKEIGRVLEPNEGKIMPSFSFLDKNPLGYQNHLYYRIKEVKLFTEEVLYTNVISVFIDEVKDTTKNWLLYPNPVDSFKGFELRNIGENKTKLTPITFIIFSSGKTLGPFTVEDQSELNQKIKSISPIIHRGMHVIRLSSSDDITYLKFFVK